MQAKEQGQARTARSHDASYYGPGRCSDKSPLNMSFRPSRYARRGKFVNGAVMELSRHTICEQPVLDMQYEAANTNQIRVLSVDGHPLMREGIASVINAQPDMRLVAHASSAQEAIQRFNEHMPDVTLMDLSLPDMSGHRCHHCDSGRIS